MVEEEEKSKSKNNKLNAANRRRTPANIYKQNKNKNQPLKE